MRLIDADALLEDIQRKAKNGFPANKSISVYAESCVVHAPTVDAVPVSRGRWIVDDFTELLKCSLCDGDAPISTVSGEQFKSNYCQYCGAKMDLKGCADNV